MYSCDFCEMWCLVGVGDKAEQNLLSVSYYVPKKNRVGR